MNCVAMFGACGYACAPELFCERISSQRSFYRGLSYRDPLQYCVKSESTSEIKISIHSTLVLQSQKINDQKHANFAKNAN